MENKEDNFWLEDTLPYKEAEISLDTKNPYDNPKVMSELKQGKIVILARINVPNYTDYLKSSAHEINKTI